MQHICITRLSRAVPTFSDFTYGTSLQGSVGDWPDLKGESRHGKAREAKVKNQNMGGNGKR